MSNLAEITEVLNLVRPLSHRMYLTTSITAAVDRYTCRCAMWCMNQSRIFISREEEAVVVIIWILKDGVVRANGRLEAIINRCRFFERGEHTQHSSSMIDPVYYLSTGLNVITEDPYRWTYECNRSINCKYKNKAVTFPKLQPSRQNHFEHLNDVWTVIFLDEFREAHLQMFAVKSIDWRPQRVQYRCSCYSVIYNFLHSVR